MGFRVNTNTASLHAQNTLSTVTREKGESATKLAGGQRINKAADDAAGLAISEKLKAEIRSSRQANRNANDGLSLVQVAEGGLTESSSILTRMRELSIQAASDTLTDSDRAKSGLEYSQLKNELERIAKSTEFNGKKLLDGSGPQLDFQVGVGDNSADDHISYNSKGLNSGAAALGVAHVDIYSKESAQQGLSAIDNAINKLSGHKSMLGSIQNRLITSSNNLQIYHENMSAANNRIRDLDYAVETSNQAKLQVLEDASTAVMSQANTDPKVALKLLA